MGGISCKGLTPLVLFGGRMNSTDFQDYFRISVKPFINQKFPQRHSLFIDNDPKVRKKQLTENYFNIFKA